jgi:hypothetical protein
VTRIPVLGAACLSAAFAVVGPVGAQQRSSAESLPKTRAESSGHTQTSTYADVRAFLDSLRALQAPLAFGVLGSSAGGHEIPYVIASRPLVRTPEDARALRGSKPVVYVQGNIHGGEVEGKEALLMLLRDLAFDPRRNVLDSVILIAVPIYNVDGNEAFGPQEQHRPSQNGPALIGRRPNAAGLDLNRDYIKAAAPETRASLAMFSAWDPDIFVDLHTTNGSLHGYAITYAPPLNPASQLGQRSREFLAALQERMRARHSLETFDYGNFGTDRTPWPERLIYSPDVQAWTTFSHEPRYSTNYYGLRGGIGILGEVYSHDPFERRVASTYAFVRELLSLAADEGAAHWKMRYRAEQQPPRPLAVAARLTRSPPIKAVRVEEVELTGDSTRTETGLRAGVRRTGRFREVRMPIYDRFESTAEVERPVSYVIPSELAAVTDMLKLHGVPLVRAGAQKGTLEEFVVDSLERAERAFEGHHQVTVRGRWIASAGQMGADDWLVPVTGRHAALVAYLLDPESDDGLVTWNFLGDHVRAGEVFPVRRMYPPGRRSER